MGGFTSLMVGVSGLRSSQNAINATSHNLANVNTNGYKTEKAEFKTLLYQTLQTRTTTANGERKPIDAQVGLGTRVASITSYFGQGPMLESESDTAFAINGDGFFSVRGADGNTYYTRKGDFKLSMEADGFKTLVTAEGYPVLDTNGNPIRIPGDVSTTRLSVSDEGAFGYLDPQGQFRGSQRFLRHLSVQQPVRIGEAVQQPAAGDRCIRRRHQRGH